jgi:hypothetical protein
MSLFQQKTTMPTTTSTTARPIAPMARALPQNPYAGIEAVQDNRRTYVTEPCNLVLKVIQLVEGNLPLEAKNSGAYFFAGDFEVVESDNASYPAGTQVSYITTLGRFPQYFLRDVKSCIASVLNVSPQMVNEATVKEAVSEANPAAGSLVRLRATPNSKGKTDETGKPYVDHQFTPFSA